MTLATALVSGNDPEPRLAEAAAEQALEKSGLAHAQGVLLFLTPEFARHAPAIVTAVARRTQCLQVAGGIASGVFTESGWALDRPAAAVMVLGNRFALGHPYASDEAILSYAGSRIPPDWAYSGRRYGGAFGNSLDVRAADAESLAWQQARQAGENGCSVQIHGAGMDIGVSRDWQILSAPQSVESSKGYDLQTLGGQSALESLTQALPPTAHGDPAGLQRMLHQIVALVSDAPAMPPGEAPAEPTFRPLAVIAAATDGALTLTGRIAPGRHLSWAIRHPDAAAADMRQCIEQLAARHIKPATRPAGAVVFSCIGRGPYFYGGEDRDLAVLTERFPGLPVIGVYGTGQIAPSRTSGTSGPARNSAIQNAVVTALVTPHTETDHV